MLNDGTGFKKVYLAAGFTDLRRGIDGLARIIRFQFQLDPYDKNTLFLFCGRRTDRIKGLLWEGDGFLPAVLLYMDDIVVLRRSVSHLFLLALRLGDNPERAARAGALGQLPVARAHPHPDAFGPPDEALARSPGSGLPENALSSLRRSLAEVLLSEDFARPRLRRGAIRPVRVARHSHPHRGGSDRAPEG